jgi:hypothetical protein
VQRLANRWVHNWVHCLVLRWEENLGLLWEEQMVLALVGMLGPLLVKQLVRCLVLLWDRGWESLLEGRSADSSVHWLAHELAGPMVGK